MESKEFIEAIKIAVEKDTIEAIISILNEPPGRSPEGEIIDLSKWYNNSNDEVKNYVKKIISFSVKSSIFHFLCVIDGVAAIERGNEKGVLQLSYQKGDEITILSNQDDYLHDIYKSLE